MNRKDYENKNIPFEELEWPKTEEELIKYLRRSDYEVNKIKQKLNRNRAFEEYMVFLIAVALFAIILKL